MIDYNDEFNPSSPVSEIIIAEGESLVAVEVNVTQKGTKGDFKRELVNELHTEDGAWQPFIIESSKSHSFWEDAICHPITSDNRRW